MLIKELTEKYGFEFLCGDSDKDIHGCYIGDLLSLAMSKVQKDNIWLTIQSNINIVAVASLTEAGCITICEGFSPDEGVIERAKQENITIIKTDKSAYEIARILVENNV